VGLYWESGVSADIPALAWYLLSSPVPIALGLTALTAAVLGDYAEAQALAARVSRVLPKDVHDQIVTLVLTTKRGSPFLIAGAVLGWCGRARGRWAYSIAVSAGCSRSQPRTRGREAAEHRRGPRRGRAGGGDGVAG
jgi:uncharacterized BrkB/YihY/UPF0761 family membrane protein